jgi:ribosomal protein S20
MPQYNFQATDPRANHIGNPYAPPVYSPFQNPAHVDDAFGYMANMYGPALVQGMFGPDAFLAHQMPGQALADQYTAARYQRTGVQSIAAANTAGNSTVAEKLIGMQRLMNGGQPVTQLDREHANTGAQVLNNPLFKSFAAAQIGAENLEGIMFGRRGDPTAIASATNRIGYFRQDAATGEKRMSADSLQQFSHNVYENLYGKDANVDEMRGSGAVAAGEMMDTLFQQGRLPQSLGALTPAERVKAVSQTKRDDKTMTRLAEQFGHKELMERDFDYANATEEEQKLMLHDKLGGYKDRLTKTFNEIDKYKANDPRAKSAEEIEQLEGFGLGANSLDAQRTSRAIKEYNGAIAAMREIFGDNGQSNAPVQQLIAGLQALTNGAQTSFSGGKVESLVRELRLAARDTNTDLDSLGAITNEARMNARQLGLQDATAEAGVARKLLLNQNMSDAGVFEKPGFGKLNRAEAEQMQRTLSDRGDASSVGRELAVMNRLVSENPEKYKGTKLEAAAKAYQNNEDTFSFDGQTYNLAEMAGRGGVPALAQIAQESGASNRIMQAYRNDQIGTEEYLKTGYAYKAQQYELQRNFSRAHGAQLSTKMAEAAPAIKPAGMSDEDFGKQRNQLAEGFAYKMTGIMMDETADMTSEERVATLERRGKEELTKYFKSSAGGNMSDAAAQKQADKYFTAMYGSNAEERRENLLATYSETSSIAQSRSRTADRPAGVSLEGTKQLYNDKAIAKTDVDQKVNVQRAERMKDVSMGTESSFTQRIGDELHNLASDDAQDRTESLKRVFNVVSEDSIVQKYAPDMQEGMVAAARMYSSATVTRKDIDKLAEAAQTDPNGPAARELKVLAGFKPDQQLTEEEQSTLAQRAAMQSVETARGTTEKEREQNKAQQTRAKTIIKAYNTGKADDVKAASRAMAQSMLGPNASKEKIEEFATAALDEDTLAFEKQMQRGFFGGGLTDEKQEEARAISAGLRAAQASGGLAGAGAEQTVQSIDAAQDRPTAKMNELTRDVSQKVRGQVEKGYDRREFEKLRPAKMSTEAFNNQRKEFIRTASDIMSSVAVSEMGGYENLKPEERAEYMEKRGKEELTKYFERQGMVPARAEEAAEKHFGALFGGNEKAVTEQMNKIYDTAITEAKEKGFDTSSGVAAQTAPAPEPQQQQAASPPAAASAKAKYDYKALGVTEKVTAQQQAVINEATKDPTGAAMKTALLDSKKRELLLTLPDDAAKEMFTKFTPQAQADALESMKSYKDSIFLGDKDRKNLSRLHDAISADKPTAEQQAQQTPQPPRAAQAAAYSSSVERFDPQTARDLLGSGGPAGGTEFKSTLHRMLGLMDTEELKAFGTGGGATEFEQLRKIAEKQAPDSPISRAVGDARETLEEQIDTLHKRGKKGWFTRDVSFADPQDTERLKGLQHMREKLISFDGLDSVNKQMESLAPKGKTGLFGGKPSFADADDQKLYDQLNDRKEQLQQQTSAGISAIRASRESVTETSRFSQTVVAQNTKQAARSEDRLHFGQKGNDMQINGTLVLQGLSEAILQASGQRMEETPDGGAPVDIAGGTGSYYGR